MHSALIAFGLDTSGGRMYSAAEGIRPHIPCRKFRMVLSCSSDAGLATPCLQALQCLRHLPLHWIITPLLGFDPIVALPADGVAYNISRNNEYIQKISNRNGRIAHIAGNTYAHPFSTQQAIGTIHIDVYIYISYIHICLGSRACPNDLVQRQPSERSITMKSQKGHSR